MGARSPLSFACAALAAWLSAVAGAALAADAALIAAAKKEGQVVWYTTQIVDQFARPAAQAFEKLYPGIRVTLSRANATTGALKLLNENRAGRNQADVFDGTTTVVPLKKAGYVLQWLPDAAKNLAGGVQGPGRLLDRDQPLRADAGVQQQPRAGGHRAQDL